MGGGDQQIAMTAGYRLWVVIAGLVTLILIPLFLSESEQGYYFTFASLLTLQVFFELGLAQVIIQLAARKGIDLDAVEWIQISGSPNVRANVQRLAVVAHHWYLIAAMLFAIGVGGLGSLYMHLVLDIESYYVFVWLIMVAFASVNLYFSSRFAILDGLGLVANSARVRLLQSIGGYTIAWLLLIMNGGIISMTCIPAVSAILAFFSMRSYGKGLLTLTDMPSEDVIWARDIFPMQWRIAVSWVSGYFMFQIFTPTIFYTQGPEEAGRIGLALAGFSAIQSIGMSWVTAKAPVFSKLIFQDSKRELDALFNRLVFQSFTFTSMIIAATIGCAFLLRFFDLPLSTRMPDLLILSILGIVSIVNLLVYAMATYLRAHCEEPMTSVSVLSALITLCGVICFAGYGSKTILLVYLGTALFVTLPWTYKIFIDKRKFSQ